MELIGCVKFLILVPFNNETTDDPGAGRQAGTFFRAQKHLQFSLKRLGSFKIISIDPVYCFEKHDRGE